VPNLAVYGEIHPVQDPMTHRVTLIPGDGIGPEVCEAARRVVEATGVEIEWDLQEFGADAYEREGPALLERVIGSVRECGVALKGPTSTPSGSGFRSINIALRRELDLYAGVRPCRALPGIATPFPQTDVVVVRMNTEDLYAGIEYAREEDTAATLREIVAETRGAELPADSGVSLKPLSRAASVRVARAAFVYARHNGRERVTAVHKATVMRATDGLFLEACREVAAGYGDIGFDDRLVDNACAKLVMRPEECDVLVMPMLYGDIVSDVAAALVGGLGVAPGANLGDEAAVFEAVHGSAPRHAGENRANPFAMMLSGAMLLRHIGEVDAASRLEGAIADVTREGMTLTYDLARDAEPATTSEVTQAVVERLR
jgi:isocitrate dehydrogenase (NAD+)